MSTLYRKYRPQSWSDVAGQEHVKDTLSFEVSSGRIAHAYLFSGPRGVGKTTIARIFAKAVNCLARPEGSGEPCHSCESCQSIAGGGAFDIVEIDAASHRGIDSVRENVIENARFAPARLKHKVFIIDEVHMMTTEAFNALLKTLEEPPANVIFLLATTELHKVPVTIVSRCQRFDFRKISVESAVARLKSVAAGEGFEVEERVLLEVSKLAEGCLRDAEGLLGKVLAAVDGKTVSYADASAVLPRSDWDASAGFVGALVSGDTTGALRAVAECLDAGADIERFADSATEILRKVLLVKMSGSAAVFATELDENQRARLAEWANAVDPAWLVRALEVMLEKRRDLKASHPVQLPLELAAIIICSEWGSPPSPPATEGRSGKAGERGSTLHTISTICHSREGGNPEKKNITSKIETPNITEPIPQPAQTVVRKAEEDAPSPAVTDEGLSITASPPPAPKQGEAGEGAPTPIFITANEPPSDIPAEQITISATSETEPIPVVDSLPVEPIAALEAVASLEDIRAVWSQFINKAAEASQSLTYLLSTTVPVEVSGKTVRIGSTFAFYCNKLNEDKTRLVLESALSAVLGREVLVEGVTLEKNSDLVHNNVAADFASATLTQAPPQPPTDTAQRLAEAFGGKVMG